MVETADTWKNGSLDAVLVFDTEDEKYHVVGEDQSTWTPSYVYVSRLKGSDKPDVDEEEVYTGLRETEIVEIFGHYLDLTDEQTAGLEYLYSLFSFRVSMNENGERFDSWRNGSQLDADADMVEAWGIEHLEAPAREITIEDLDSMYAIVESNREAEEVEKEEAAYLYRAAQEEEELDEQAAQDC